MTVVSAIGFLARDPLYEEEKPYRLKYDAEADFKPSNIITVPNDKHIQDVRDHVEDITIAKHGFQLLNLAEEMSYDDYDDGAKVRTVYLKQVAEGVKGMLGASRVQIFEHVLRKRHAQFPIATGEPYKYNQPTTVAHVDMTPEWAAGTAKRLNDSFDEELPSGKFQFVNIWKPLRGPVRDWPLALCDPKTIRSDDLRPCDLVYSSVVVENYAVHTSTDQRWYYLRDQTASEAWVFLQADSDIAGGRGVPHSSFLHPESTECDQPRESIEVRALVLYD